MQSPDAALPAPGLAVAGDAGSLADMVRTGLSAGGALTAIGICEAKLAAAPADPDAHRHLGLLHAACGDHGSALRAARRACELAPDDPRAWSDLGRVHAMLGNLAEAAVRFNRATEADLRDADAWHNLGMVLHKLHRIEPAFIALKNALLLDPARADTYFTLGNLLVETEQLEDALECFERAARLNPALARVRSTLADQLSRRGKLKRAETLFRQSLALDPDHIQGWCGLGRALEDLGEADGALACYGNVLRRRPDHASALGQYLALLQVDAPAELLGAARKALHALDMKDEPRALIGYGLAKYHDRRGDHSSAATAGFAANAARRKLIGPLDREALVARIDGLIRRHGPDYFRSRRRFGIGTDQPVFIVGLPRSGTTLTEQILAAHPLLHGAGELPDLARLAARAMPLEAPGSGRDPPDDTAVRIREIAHAYLRRLRDGARKHRLRISDKAPLNFFHLAFAALLFPNARVIHCCRDARDNALSIWMENFNAEQRYATDFGDLAFYFTQYRRLMAHWQAVLPLRILDVRYEDTVTDVESQARRVMQFLGVPWDVRCLDFHRNKRAVQTPSRWQVRQPVYTRSVQRWRAYAQYLPELVAAFAGSDAPIDCQV